MPRSGGAPCWVEEAGRYGEGQVAVVDNASGRGRTRLVGTFPGYGHHHRPSDDSRAFFADLAAWTGLELAVRVVDPERDGPRSLVARLHTSAERTFLWVVNHARTPVTARVELGAGIGAFKEARPRWGAVQPLLSGRLVRVEVGERDVAVVELRR